MYIWPKNNQLSTKNMYKQTTKYKQHIQPTGAVSQVHKNMYKQTNKNNQTIHAVHKGSQASTKNMYKQTIKTNNTYSPQVQPGKCKKKMYKQTKTNKLYKWPSTGRKAGASKKTCTDKQTQTHKQQVQVTCAASQVQNPCIHKQTKTNNTYRPAHPASQVQKKHVQTNKQKQIASTGQRVQHNNHQQSAVVKF